MENLAGLRGAIRFGGPHGTCTAGTWSAVTDVKDRIHAAGVGINIAQRVIGLWRKPVISCFRARVAEDLQQGWTDGGPSLHDLV